MRHTDAALKQYYAARAREYERIYAKPERQADFARLKQLLPPMFADRRILVVARPRARPLAILERTRPALGPGRKSGLAR